MKILDITAITNSSQFPLKKGTLQFLQDAPKEIVSSLIQALIGSGYSAATMYVLTGCINTGTLPVYTVSAGKIFYNGEVFDFDGASFTATGSNVGIFSIIQTQFTVDADPVTYTDTAVRNVHNIRKMQLTQAISGTGLADYLMAFFLTFKIPAQLNLTGTNLATISGVYPNLTIDVPANTNLAPVIWKGSYNCGDIPTGIAGGGAFNVVFGSTLSTATYYVIGSFLSNGNPVEDSTLGWSWHNPTTTGFILNVREMAGTIQNVAFKYLIFAV